MLFAALSGCGWICDFLTFTLLDKYLGAPPFAANFGSSYVGVTFVWFTSLKSVFGRSEPGQNRYIVVYWAFQFFSILAYSQVLSLLVNILQQSSIAAWAASHLAIVAKIIITPFNLVTNYMFMKALSRFMRNPDTA
nr:GtrA family protein [Cupriavidus gilardii]